MTETIPLFAEYPVLEAHIPYRSLAKLPTPVERLARLEDELDLRELYVKRDDQSGLEYGGNKVRKLEFLLAEAKTRGCKSVLTFGAAGSNHALATAVYAKQIGLRCVSLLAPQKNARYVGLNLKRAYVAGSEMHAVPAREVSQFKTVRHWANELLAEGCRPMIIPMGGSSALGCLGFVNAAFELREQVRKDELPEPDLLYVALGTMGTAVGLALGLAAAGLKTRVVAVRVVADFIASERLCERLIMRATSLLNRHGVSISASQSARDLLEIRHDFFGGNYAVYTPEGMEAVTLLRSTQSIGLEGTYTGKAMAALLDDARRGKLSNKVVLFWNTYSSVPPAKQLMDIDYHDLPEAFHRYFNRPVQELDR